MPMTLMIQGTTSDAGKSTLVAALCRVLARRGLAVAPFKPQNMALNSAVTEEGGEIGRAQALQAYAAGLPPRVDFNPILIKPSSDTTAQIIVQGKALSEMDALGFHQYKSTAMAAVLDSYRRLQGEFDYLMVEGAGSPAEINLRERDIANMGFAEAVDCPVVLVADIDKGGVFAHLVGTLALLSESEQARVLGFVINKFRGDLALLEPGLRWLEEKTGKPVLAVLPYVHDLYLDAEDAIAVPAPKKDETLLRVCVPVFKRISNHTDVDALRLHPQVQLEFIGDGMSIPACDLIVLPGSKNVVQDLAQLRQNQWHKDIARHLRYGGKLLGICGGFQMLGEVIEDPLSIENKSAFENTSATRGLGYFAMRTVFATEKTLKQVSGTLQITGDEYLAPAAFQGYEIHHGQTDFFQCYAHPVTFTDGGSEGAVSDDGQILGSYVHGLMDHPDSLQHILQWCGVHTTQRVDLAARREDSVNRIADVLARHCDVEALLERAGRWRQAE